MAKRLDVKTFLKLYNKIVKQHCFEFLKKSGLVLKYDEKKKQ